MSKFFLKRNCDFETRVKFSYEETNSHFLKNVWKKCLWWKRWVGARKVVRVGELDDEVGRERTRIWWGARCTVPPLKKIILNFECWIIGNHEKNWCERCATTRCSAVRVVRASPAHCLERKVVIWGFRCARALRVEKTILSRERSGRRVVWHHSRHSNLLQKNENQLAQVVRWQSARNQTKVYCAKSAVVGASFEHSVTRQTLCSTTEIGLTLVACNRIKVYWNESWASA